MGALGNQSEGEALPGRTLPFSPCSTLCSCVRCPARTPIAWPWCPRAIFVDAGNQASNSYPRLSRHSRFYRRRVRAPQRDVLPAGSARGSAGRPWVMSAQIVEPNYFDTMGLRPVHGRAFEAVEAGPVAVISNGVWLSEFGADPSVLGRCNHRRTGRHSNSRGCGARRAGGPVRRHARPPPRRRLVARGLRAVGTTG